MRKPISRLPKKRNYLLACATKEREMDEKTRQSLDRIIHYLEDAERKNWLDAGKPENHVYCDVVQFQSWLIDRFEFRRS